MTICTDELLDDSKSDVIDFKLIDKIGSSSNVPEIVSKLRGRGLLLKNPRDTTPLHARGVSKEWLSVFLALLPPIRGGFREGRIGWNTTKLVADVIKRLTSSTERPLFDYIPKRCVKPATVFVSYAWDYVVKKFVDDLPDEGYFWIDFCAVSQHSNSHSKKEIASIGDVVKRINNTRLIVDATYMVESYCSYIAKLGHSLTRAWVLYEIVSTPKASLKIQLQCTVQLARHMRRWRGPKGYSINRDKYIPVLWKQIALGKKPENTNERDSGMYGSLKMKKSRMISVVPPVEHCGCRDKPDKDMILALLKDRFGTFEGAHQFIMKALERAANEKLRD